MKKAIIAFGVGYQFDDLKYFIHSCHLSVPKAELFLFVGANIADLRQRFQDYPNVRFIRYKENFIGKVIAKALMRSPFVAKLYARLLNVLGNKLGAHRLIDNLASPLSQFMVKRFFRLRSFLRQLDHDAIMITDLRDVIVQADPFATLSSNTLITGTEPIPIRDSIMNVNWMRTTYSDKVYERLKDRAVICTGVTIGSRKAIDQYLDEMLKDTYANLHKIINLLGPDQAIHIRLCYEGLMGLDVQLESNGTGKIATLHFSRLTEFTLEGNRLENRKGAPLAVIHQYDRHPALMNILQQGLMSGDAVAA